MWNRESGARNFPFIIILLIQYNLLLCHLDLIFFQLKKKYFIQVYAHEVERNSQCHAEKIKWLPVGKVNMNYCLHLTGRDCPPPTRGGVGRQSSQPLGPTLKQNTILKCSLSWRPKFNWGDHLLGLCRVQDNVQVIWTQSTRGGLSVKSQERPICSLRFSFSIVLFSFPSHSQFLLWQIHSAITKGPAGSRKILHPLLNIFHFGTQIFSPWLILDGFPPC